MRRGDWALVGLSVAAVAATAAHGWAHATIPVPSPTWRLVLVLIVLFGAPLAGATLVLSGRRSAGAWTLAAAGGAGLAVEGLLHFVVANSDHVATVEHGHALFANTAALSTLGDAALLVGGGAVLYRASRSGP